MLRADKDKVRIGIKKVRDKEIINYHIATLMAKYILKILPYFVNYSEEKLTF